jgi:hypothetical protein
MTSLQNKFRHSQLWSTKLNRNILCDFEDETETIYEIYANLPKIGELNISPEKIAMVERGLFDCAAENVVRLGLIQGAEANHGVRCLQALIQLRNAL